MICVAQDLNLVPTAADKTIKIWNALDGKYEQTLEGHAKGISDISWSSDSKYICSASDDKSIKIWDVATVYLSIIIFIITTSIYFSYYQYALMAYLMGFFVRERSSRH